jgi:hypothetical protein
MSKKTQLSLIVTYRSRELHLKTQIAWWKMQLSLGNLSDCEMVVVEADAIPSDWIQEEIYGTNIQYVHLRCAGVFHKTKALNLGLALARGEFVAPFDVDLIPVGDTLAHHLQMAALSPHLLMTGYRVMSNSETVDVDNIQAVLEQTFIAPEDMPTAVWKHLIRRERFGVVPLFKRERLIEINGWDEAFVGWGAEDQDIMERYLQDGYFLCRSPEIVYLHLFHEPNKQWAEAELVEENRNHYYAKMSSRQKDS